MKPDQIKSKGLAYHKPGIADYGKIKEITATSANTGSVRDRSVNKTQ
jgi:hypothetical protein